MFVICSSFSLLRPSIYNRTDWHKDGLQGRVKVLTVKEYAATSVSTQQDELLESSIRYYNEQGFLTEIKEFNGDGTLAQRQVFVYTKKETRREELFYDENGALFEKIITKLNFAGSPIQSVVMDAHGNVQEKNTYQYDEKERLLKQSGYDASGKLAEKSYYTYQNDVLNQYLSFSEYENKKILYKYDAQKNPVELLVYHSKTNVFLEKVTQEFDRNKNLITANYWDEKNILKSSVSYKYDEKDNLLEYIVLDIDKSILDMFSFVYQYDRYSNWIGQTVYKGREKQIESRMERIIAYYEE